MSRVEVAVAAISLYPPSSYLLFNWILTFVTQANPFKSSDHQNSHQVYL